MKNLVFTDYFSEYPKEIAQIVDQLSNLYSRFPASSVVNLFYLKLLQEFDSKEFEKKKAKILLSMPNRSLILKSKIQLPKLQSEMKKEMISPNSEPIISTDHKDEISMLIDKFTVNPPKMIFDPTRHNPNVNYEKEVSVGDFELVSETLAMIYAEQGYVGKAEKMLRKLGLLFPEKNSYFADQIKKIKNKDLYQ
jgi:hypothetical protein